MATKIPFTGKFKITCTYGQKGNYWANGVHQGLDLVGVSTKTVYSICNGVVERAGYDKGGFGNYVRIKEDGTENRIYLAHLAKIYVKVGQKVSYVTKIGIMGSTGNSTGPHTHVEIRRFSGGKAVAKLNPATYMGVPNKKGSYKSDDFQMDDKNNATEIRTFARKTNIRDHATTYAVAHLYKEGTTVEMLELDVAVADGYHWDKVRAIATGRVGYVAFTNERYK